MASGAGSNGSDPTWPNPGSIKLNKTAEPTGNFGEWKVTLTLEGKQLKTTTDIVLVIDKSGSMNTGTRLTKAKEAAKSFADSLLTSDSGIRLAAVAFSEGKASQVSGFTDASGRADFKKNIDKITASGGTNIQAGLNAADDLLNRSPADKKYIVLLSDGEPTYSYQGTAAENSVWPDNRYNFAITKFDFNSVKGAGNSYKFLDFFGNPNPYRIGSYKVEDNGLPTISHAKLLLKQGISIYSIGLEVGNNNNAEYVLGNSQDRGYYSATSEDLQRVFSEISSDIKFAARDAVVSDPMGEKFNLQPGALNGQDYEVSQGEVVWDEAMETFRWEVGTISEGKPATLSYIVVIDPAANPVSDTLYPTNGKTTIDYTNVYGDPHVEKEFIVPEVKIGHVKILVKGYAVNLDGEPVNAAGEVVSSPDLAEQLYSDYHAVNGENTFPVGGAPISVPSRQIDGYQLKVGDDPTIVTPQAVADNIVKFGYAKVIEKSVTVKYVDRETDRAIADPDVIDNAVVGQHIELEAKSIPGYTPEEPTEYSYLVENKDNNEYIFYYTANEQTVVVKYLEKGTEKELSSPTSVAGKTGEVVKLEAVSVPGYTPEKAEDTYTVKAEGNEYIFYYTANEQTVTVKYLEKGTEKELSSPISVAGKTGEVVNLEAVSVPGYTPEKVKDTYTVKAGENEYIFYYTANEQTVTVKYLEKGTEKELSSPTSVAGKTGEVVKLEAVSIPGYTPEKAEDTYTVKAEGNEYIFYYTANEQTVTVKYLEKGTEKELSSPTSVAGKTGEVVKLEAVSIPGYTPEKAEDTYTVKAGENEYIFYYVQDEQPIEERSVTLHHLEEGTGAVLKDTEIHSGKIGDTLSWTAENITVTDTVYVPVQLNHSYKITDEVVQDYTIYYKKSEPEENLKLTIQYLDRASGEPVAVTDAVYGSEGKVITLLPKAPTVTDAVYVPELESVEYTFSAELEQSYIFYYNKKTPEPAEQTVTVKYLEQGTNHQLANPTTVKGKVGDTLTLTAVSVSGYTPTKSSDTYQIGDSESQEYIFYYTKNSTSGPSPGGSYTSYTPPSPPPPIVPPLPPLPPKLDTENHFDYIQGYPDGMVKPQNNISREEVAAIFYRLMEGESRANYYSTTNSYDDVKSTRWSNKHISTMTNAGIITGYPDGVFKPGQSITRAEFAAIAARFDKLDERESGLFTDISGHWAEKYILSAGNKGWIKGYTDGTFRPNQYITRAEAMSFINSVLNRKVKEDGIHKDAKKWPDNPATSWFYEDVIEATNNHDYSRNADGYEAWDQLKPHRIEP
nr:S-layer homology domain-containing protein [Paenibacillus aceti]